MTGFDVVDKVSKTYVISNELARIGNRHSWKDYSRLEVGHYYGP